MGWAARASAKRREEMKEIHEMEPGAEKDAKAVELTGQKDAALANLLCQAEALGLTKKPKDETMGKRPWVKVEEVVKE